MYRKKKTQINKIKTKTEITKTKTKNKNQNTYLFYIRYKKFAPEVELQVHKLIWDKCKDEPFTTLGEYKCFLHSKGYSVSKSYLQQLFKKWRWSWKKPGKVQIQKYTHENMTYYIRWIVGIGDIPWKKLKFLDEAHCVSKGKSFLQKNKD